MAGATSGLEPATLEQTIALAGLLTRNDHKYLLTSEQLVEFIDRLGGQFHVLEIDGRRQFRYESVYFDTPDLLFYRQHLQGRRRRYKVRIRTYVDSSDCMFEVKLKGHRGQTIKARLPHSFKDRSRLTGAATAFLDRLLRSHYGITAPALVPASTVAYTRTTLVDLNGGVRPTLDVDLRCSNGDWSVPSQGNVLVETKSPGHDSVADGVLRKLGVRPLRLSKYSLAIAVLHPGTVANPLHRTLRRCFDWPECIRHSIAR